MVEHVSLLFKSIGSGAFRALPAILSLVTLRDAPVISRQCHLPASRGRSIDAAAPLARVIDLLLDQVNRLPHGG